MHVLDASRAVPVTTSLLSEDGRDAFVAVHRAEYDALRKQHAGPKQPTVPITIARARRMPIEWRAERFTPHRGYHGVRVLDDVPLATLREYIDWTPFFHAWELKGVYPRIFAHKDYGAQAKQIFAEANVLLDRMIAEKLITARGVYGLFPANAVGDDVELYTEVEGKKVREHFHFLRQQANKEGSEPCRSLSDFIAPKETGLADHIGAFAVTSGIGLKELVLGFKAQNDDYNAIMAEAIADRLAEAFAECLHERVRDEWGYGRAEKSWRRRTHPREVSRHPSPRQATRPARITTEKGTLWRLTSMSKPTPGCRSPSRLRCGLAPA